MKISEPFKLLSLPARHFFWGALGIVLFASVVISGQVSDRWSFANGELYDDVLNRWGTPIHQPAPSVRYVESGSVFNTLHPMPLQSQQVRVDASMSYRKRGLVYFSGFEFDFSADYVIENTEEFDIDVVFVFPIHAQKNRILMSDLHFYVGDDEVDIEFDEENNSLVWTGRLQAGDETSVGVDFRGKGLDSFTYHLDPSLPANDVHFDINIEGGDNYDYAAGTLPADIDLIEGDRISLSWVFPALESGIPVGVVLPSEESFDSIILTMIKRSWATFVLLFASIILLSAYCKREILRYESYLIASSYVFFFVLLPYFAAQMHFYLAYPLTFFIIGALLVTYLRNLFPELPRLVLPGLIMAFLGIPTLAVILQGYTGLIYALEILIGLAVVMYLTTRSYFRDLLDEIENFSPGDLVANTFVPGSPTQDPAPVSE